MFYKEFKGVAYKAYQLMRQDLINMAMKELNVSEDDLVVRDLRPEDIIISGTPQWSKTTNVTGGWATGGSGWRIDRSGSVARYWHIQELIPNNENNVMYVDDPIIIPQNNLLTIKGYSLTSATEYLRLIGLTVERKGLLLSP